MGTWRNPAGIDFWTAFKIPLNGDGGSTIPMMISRHMRKTLPDRNEPVQAKIWRKLKEWQEAPAIWRELGEPDNRAGLKAWSAQHVALVTNLINPLAGDRLVDFGLDQIRKRPKHRLGQIMRRR